MLLSIDNFVRIVINYFICNVCITSLKVDDASKEC